MTVSAIASQIYQAAKAAARDVWNWRLEWSEAMKKAWRKIMMEASPQQLAIRKGVKDTAEHFKANTICETATDDIYEQLAMIYMSHRAAGMAHEAAVERSFARLNGNGVSNQDMVMQAMKTIEAQAEIVAGVKAQAGL